MIKDFRIIGKGWKERKKADQKKTFFYLEALFIDKRLWIQLKKEEKTLSFFAKKKKRLPKKEKEKEKEKEIPNKKKKGREEKGKKEKEKEKEKQKNFAGLSSEFKIPYMYPLGMYGRNHPPKQPEYLLLKGGTLWTCAKNPQILRNWDMLVHKGKIKKIEKNISPPQGAVILDCRGKHITPGIIDAHSHMAIQGGVNEGSEADTAEVRISDVLDPSDIAIYRQLAGGTTMAHLLHGSANPIGGQNAIIKLKWGEGMEEMLVKDGFSTIKFALGENVKWSNRYPKTRMGVEQFFRQRLALAKAYKRKWRSFLKGKVLLPPRKDLDLDALVEVLEGKRKVHCHCYRQDGILMLMKVARDYGFRICTFQHVLEGYKIAREIKHHGAHVSTFSDWWAYKHEAYDAIPYNGALMYRVGLVVSFNSDSDEMGRRLNFEAAKAIKYGNVPPQEALKFVTLNPAIQLGVDHRTGSLEVGKDADFVIWSSSPLSAYTRCLETWIEGKKYFDRSQSIREYKKGIALKKRIFKSWGFPN
ncbi:MAG: hypothetical protein D6785_06150 [Planctomycetota bacterium]|nr:MAG: hypothetical protein D6785_06150 [Planctomycetota bacterium]